MKSYWKLGCRWGSKSEGKPLFFDLLLREKIVISWVDKDFGNGSNVLLTDGFTPLGIAITKSERKSIITKDKLKEEFLLKQIDFSQDLYYYEADIFQLLEADFTFDYQKGISRIWNTNTHSHINRNLNHLINLGKMTNFIQLLKYKKQIILQGPPGTGKTRLAKQIAEEVIDLPIVRTKPLAITNKDIVDILKNVEYVKSVAGNVDYKIVKIDESKQLIVLEKSTGLHDVTYFPIIKDFYLNKSFERSFDTNSERRAAAITKYIYENIGYKDIRLNVEDSSQYKIVQFHPSYTYEDFVRGIIVNANEEGDGVIYKSINKVLARFAEDALKNLIDSKKPANVLSAEEWVRNKIKEFQKYLDEKLSKQEKVWLTKDVAYITRITPDTIRYKGDNWRIDGGVPYSDLEKMFLANITLLSEIRELNSLTLSAKSNATYWQKLLELFKDFLASTNSILPTATESARVMLKNYVLVIDEINRANLSSVLGELIYALEYRGEEVESIYKNDLGNNKLILPPNLFIIGTMNTADRSVGHIDYAIRRRFAFVDVLPNKLDETPDIWFNTLAYEMVEKLFNKNYVTSDFDAKDVQIGHSYFLVKKEDAPTIEQRDELFKMKMKYEVIPILREYLKDGILNSEAEKEIALIESSFK